jgi:predicted membrane channel-forming protein YqfA (hemolysin III family)
MTFQQKTNRLITISTGYAACWIIAMILCLIFGDRHSNLSLGIILFGLLGWMYVPIMIDMCLDDKKKKGSK